MKMKFALFMFALGLGSSFAYAAESSTNSVASCRSWCTTNYLECRKHSDVETCLDLRDACWGRCGGIIP
ncbi:hypothetical protein ACFOLJ_19960 [Rugamonas sp. CCM 8940]|uniref:hypothetical protein n=1 Tax=Rugamonas sp. CCM 8940 TaxID=2765359 RepID=UPI0018F66199|nr:hypothetical protein [Rugamonas sp. CCM 8940]MBJ7313843.1 hypothetical protein [Rugamonas sp. CCM 8940]